VRYVLGIVILVEAIGLGFYTGRSFQLKQLITKQESCNAYVLKDDINLNKFYGLETKGMSVGSIFALAFGATAYKYNNCMWGKE